MLFLVNHETAARLIRFVEQGGTLVMTYLSAYVDENSHCFFGGNPGGPGLRRLFGIWNEDIDGLEPSDMQSIQWDTESYEVADYAELIHLEGAEALAVFEQDFYAGSPAVTVNRFGKGSAYYIAARTGMDFLRKFYRDLALENGVVPLLPDLPGSVRAARRVAADGSEFFFLANMGEEKVEISLPGPMIDIWNGAASPVKSFRLPVRGSTVLKWVAGAGTGGKR